MDPLHSTYQPSAAPAFDQIVIAGGGLAAFFTAYEILKEANAAGRKLDVLVLADKINAPCTAGSHIVLELEGLFDNPGADNTKIAAMLRDGLGSLRDTVSREGIDCRLDMGYEIKSKTREALDDLVGKMLKRDIYKPEEIQENSEDQQFHLTGHPYSVAIDSIGQINMVELLGGLVNAVEKLGGTVMTGIRYESQSRNADGSYLVRTDKGSFTSKTKPLLATGAEHQQSLDDYKRFNADVVYTMGLVLGPLDQADFEKISGGKPRAICNTDLEGDVLWGGVDEKRFLTMGRGDLESPDGKDALKKEIMDLLDDCYPGITQKYPPSVSFGAMSVTPNRMPVVGRLPQYDVMGGWAGMGIVAGYAAAKAYASWLIHGDDTHLKIFEAMQPGQFAGALTASPPSAALKTGTQPR